MCSSAAAPPIQLQLQAPALPTYSSLPVQVQAIFRSYLDWIRRPNRTGIKPSKNWGAPSTEIYSFLKEKLNIWATSRIGLEKLVPTCCCLPSPATTGTWVAGCLPQYNHLGFFLRLFYFLLSTEVGGYYFFFLEAYAR